MRRALTILLILVAGVAAAEEITADHVIIAYRLGADAETIISKLADSGNTVAVPSLADLEKLRAEGVPDDVVLAMMQHSQAKVQEEPAEMPAAAIATQPDNPRLVEVVRLVRAGLSENLVEEQIRQGGVERKPTVNDLIYLKENDISEGLITALMNAPVAGEPTAPAAPPVPGTDTVAAAQPAPVAQPEQTAATPRVLDVIVEGEDEEPAGVAVSGLVLAGRSMSIKRDRAGRLILGTDKIWWLDSGDKSRNLEIFVAGIDRFKARCYARAEGEFCHEVEIELNKGDDFQFHDVNREVGGNPSISALLEVIAAQYPNLSVKKKIRK